MPQKPPLHPGAYYHIYNRGINKAPLFRNDKDFQYFLYLMRIYLPPVAEVLSYALMKNHFHIALRLKAIDEIGWLDPATKDSLDPAVKWATSPDKPNTSKPTKPAGDKMIAHLCDAYAKRYNARHGRVSRLFEDRFERIISSTERQLRQTIIYINRNPEKHGVTKVFSDYPWISYHALIENDETFISVSKVMELFGDRETFILAMKKVDIDEWLNGED